MNKILKYGVICSLSMLTMNTMTSCKDALDEVLYSELGDENAFVTASDALACVNGIYQPLTGIANRTMAYLNDMPSDVGAMTGLVTETLNQNGMNTHEDVNLMWNRCYSMITRANIALVRIPLIAEDLFIPKNGTPEDGVKIKKRYIAEAKAMRALSYYMLVDSYYKVPLVTDPETPIASYPPLTDVDVIDAQIIKDLGEAIGDLPKSYTAQEDYGRISQAGAKGMLMRAHMRKAGRDRANGKDATEGWTAALALANDIIGNYPQYSLVNDLWAGLYDPKSTTALYNNEAIITFKANPNGSQGSSSIGLTYTPWNLDMGWNLINIPLQFYWQFDPADKRVASDIFVTDYPNVYNNAKQQFFYAVPKKMADAGNMSISEVIIDGVKYKTDEEGACYTWKYRYARSGTYNYSCGNNFYYLRLADIYLCKAECINELSGPTGDAVAAVDKIRSRAFGDDAHGLKAEQYASKDVFRRTIATERAFELHSEGTRRQDLIRMGLWKEVMSAHFEAIKQTVRAKELNADIKYPADAPHDYSSQWKVYPFDLQEKDLRMYFPIPKRESDLNPGYLDNRVF